MLCNAFAAVLKAAREDFNAQFRQAQHTYPALDATAFSEFLHHAADPLVSAVASVRPDAVVDTARAAYEFALTLVGRQLAGSRAREPWVAKVWRSVLCAAAPLVARDPWRLISAVSNATLNLAATPGVRTTDWITGLQAVAPRAEHAETLLALGKILAWRCGMAHFRQAALAAAAQLPPALTLAAVGVTDTLDWAAERERLAANPWHVPGQVSPLKGLVTKAGRFRGFGGLFVTPPCVGVIKGQIIVQSGGEAWQLHADAFGATFLRLSSRDDYPLLLTNTATTTLPADIALPAWLGNPTSMAVTRSTAAVTGATTHSVLLFARAIAI